MGMSRSATIVIAYLMWKERIGVQEAYKSLKQVRPTIRPNRGFKEQLCDFHKAQMSIEQAQSRREKRTSAKAEAGSQLSPAKSQEYSVAVCG